MYSLSKEESDRIKIVKFIAIIFVVYIHSYNVKVNFSDGTDMLFLPMWLQLFEDGMSQVVSRCGVPLFFLISSILFFKTDKTYVDTIKKKTKTLLLPYLIWNTFWIVVFAFLQSMPFTAIYFSGNNTPILQRSLIGWLELYGIGKGFPSPQCYPLWFMRDLMMVLLIFPIIKMFVKKYPQIMLIIGIGLIFIPGDFSLKTALAWFIIGAAIVKMQIHITIFDKISIKAITCVYLTGALISLLLEIGIVRNIFIFIGIIFWIRISKEINDNES